MSMHVGPGGGAMPLVNWSGGGSGSICRRSMLRDCQEIALFKVRKIGKVTDSGHFIRIRFSNPESKGLVMKLKMRISARGLASLVALSLIGGSVAAIADAPSPSVSRADRVRAAKARQAKARRNIARRPAVRRQAVRRARVAPQLQQQLPQSAVVEAPYAPPSVAAAPPPAPPALPPAVPAPLPQLSVAPAGGGSGLLYGLLGAAALGGAIAGVAGGGSSSP